MEKYNKVVLHIPHAQTKFPFSEDYLNEDEYKFTLNNLTDHYTDELFDLKDDKVEKVVFPYSRLFCDVERYFDNDKEPMFKKGMGYYYTKGLNGIEFRKFDQSVNNSVELAYHKHHDYMRSLLNNNNTLLIDCHSFSNERFINDGIQTNMDLTDICIGYNKTYNKELVDYLVKTFKDFGYSVDENSIFKGVLDYGYSNCDCVMIEINKRLYMNNDLSKKSDFYKIQNILKHILSKLY